MTPGQCPAQATPDAAHSRSTANLSIRTETAGFWGAHTASQNHCKPLCRVRNAWALGHTRTPKPSQNPSISPETSGFRGAHRIAKTPYPVRNGWVLRHTPHPDTITKPLYQHRNWWILERAPHRKAPLSGPKLVGFGGTPRTPTPSQNPFLRTETGGFCAPQNPFIRSEIGGFWGTPGTPTRSQNPFIRTETHGFWGAHGITKPLYPVRNRSQNTLESKNANTHTHTLWKTSKPSFANT